MEHGRGAREGGGRGGEPRAEKTGRKNKRAKWHWVASVEEGLALGRVARADAVLGDLALVVLDVAVGAGLEQLSHDFDVSVTARIMERSVAEVVLRVRVGTTVLDHPLNAAMMALVSGNLQRRQAVRILERKVGSASLEDAREWRPKTGRHIHADSKTRYLERLQTLDEPVAGCPVRWGPLVLGLSVGICLVLEEMLQAKTLTSAIDATT
jgi:hypothetical protein